VYAVHHVGVLTSPEAKRKGVELQHWTQPLFADLLISGDQVIPVFFGARHVARLPNWQICWQTDNSSQQGLSVAVF
jgi:hypothetical protein